MLKNKKLNKKQPVKRVLKKRKSKDTHNKNKAIGERSVDIKAVNAGEHNARLNPRQMRLVDEYMIDFNAYRAYCMAGYRGRGNSGYVSAHGLIKKNKYVVAEVEHRKALIARQTKVTPEDVIKELKIIAFSNIADYVEFGGKRVRIKPSHELTRSAMSVIEQVVESTNTAGMKSVKLKLHPKLAALTMLAKYTDIDKGDGDRQESAETLAQAMKDAAKMMTGTLPTSDGETVTTGEFKRKKKVGRKKVDNTECEICEIPKRFCECED